MKIVLIAFCLSLSASAATKFHCRGTEPFWNLKILPDRISFDGIEGDKEYRPVGGQPAINGTTQTLIVFKTERLDSHRTPLTIVIRKDSTCSDGMSEQKYSHNAVLVEGSNGNAEIVDGCCHAFD